MTKYKVTMDDGRSEETEVFEAPSDDDAMRYAEATSAAWCRDGIWDHNGTVVTVRYTVTAEIGSGSKSVDIPPNHRALIHDLVGYPHCWPERFCGLDPAIHDWSREGEGGCNENPGVWSQGSAIVVTEHCSACCLRRQSVYAGVPGQCDSVKYTLSTRDTE